MTGRIVALLALLGCLSACVAIPHDGPVHAVDSAGNSGQSGTRFEPAGPRPGATRSEILRGFLESMLAYPESQSTVNQFLTPEAIDSWDSQVGSVIYSTARVIVPARQGDSHITLSVVGELDRQGRFTHVTERREIPVRFAQHDEEWRIAELPPGMLISDDFFDDHFRPFDLAFFDETGTRLIAEPIHAVVGEKLVTKLVHALALGPSEAYADWQQSFVPPLDAFQSSVPLIDGRAQVDVDVVFGDRDLAESNRMLAQIIDTLQDAPGVESIRVSGIDGVAADTAAAENSAPSWAGFGVDDSRRYVHVVSENHVFRVDSDTPRPAPSYLGRDAQSARSVTMSRERLAAVWSDRAQTAAINGDEPVDLAGSNFLDPAVDVFDNAWFVDSTAGRSRLRVVADEHREELALPPEVQVTSFAISPDGARLAMTTAAGQLMVARIIRDQGRAVDIAGISRLDPDVNRNSATQTETGAITTVQWLTPTALVFATADAPRQLREVRVDGSASATSWSTYGRWLPDITLVRLVVSPSEHPLATIMDSEDRVWLWDTSTWKQVDINKPQGLA